MRHRMFHCWDCGTRVIEQSEEGRYKPAQCLQQVKFKLSNGSYMVNPFCGPCAGRPWFPERLEEFRRAIIEVMPGFSEVSISSCEGPVGLNSPIAGVFQ